MSTAGWAMGTALKPLHNMFKMSTMAAALTPHEQSLHYMVTHGTHTGTLVASVTYPALVTHGSFAVTAVYVQCGRGLIQAGDGTTCT